MARLHTEKRKRMEAGGNPNRVSVPTGYHGDLDWASNKQASFRTQIGLINK